MVTLYNKVSFVNMSKQWTIHLIWTIHEQYILIQYIQQYNDLLHYLMLVNKNTVVNALVNAEIKMN